MMPTYHSMQFVILDKHNKDYEVGDVIAFTNDNVDGVLIKRIVAGPGDRIQIKHGTLYLNETPSIYYTDEVITFAGIITEELELQANSFFVMGDNHEYSKDSRYGEIGCIEKDNILGKVILK